MPMPSTKLRAAVGRDAVNGAVVAAGDVKIALVVERQARGIHQFGDERLDLVIGGDFVERDGNFLAALAAVGDVDVAFGVHGGIGDRMQIVGDLHAELNLDMARSRRARSRRGPRFPMAPSGTRAMSWLSPAITRLASASPNRTRGRVPIARPEAAAREWPLRRRELRRSGVMLSMRGVRSVANACDERSIAIKPAARSRGEPPRPAPRTRPRSNRPP